MTPGQKYLKKFYAEGLFIYSHSMKNLQIITDYYNFQVVIQRNSELLQLAQKNYK